jgi:beta-mannosidase
MLTQQTIDLNGKWDFTFINKGAVNAPMDKALWRKADVPGDVHLDLMSNGLLDEPFVGLNSHQVEAFEDKEWHYERQFDFVRPSGAFRARLVFEGLDCIADIYLNDRLVGKTENAFIPHVFELGKELKDGANILHVKLTNGLETIGRWDRKKYLAEGKGFERIFLRKPQFSFGWDWAKRLVTCGIWRPVRLEVSQCGFVDNLYVINKLADDLKSSVASYGFEYDAPVEKSGPQIAQIAITRQGKTVFAGQIKLKNGLNAGTATIKKPDLWWPAGWGEQDLYEFTVSLPGSNLTESIRFGIRKIEVVQTPVKEGGKLFYFRINNKKIFCKGSNWAPADSIVARVTDAKVNDLLTEAVTCNFNMLRVWGGGVYESEHFYNRCDELGILVWQEFLYACHLYPDDDKAYYDNCMIEAVKGVKRLRNHPSIALWTGNNEVHEAWLDVYKPRGAAKLYGDELWSRGLPSVLKKYSPGTYYQPSSPFGGDYPKSEIEGDCHSLMTGLTFDERTDIRIALKGVGRFMSEFYTWQSPVPLRSMKRFLSAEGMRQGSEEYLHHANDWYQKSELGVVKRYITNYPEKLSLEHYCGLLQRLHAEHMEAQALLYRRRSDICGGSLFWGYNDCWPTSGWSTHDYYVERKALYYGVKRGYAPLAICFKEEESGLSVWVSNLSDRDFKGVAVFGRYRFTDGKKMAEYKVRVSVKSGETIKAGFFYTPLSWPWESLASFAMARLYDSAGLPQSSARKIFTSYKGLSGEEFHFGPDFYRHVSILNPKISVRLAGDKTLLISSDVPAFGVHIDADHLRPDDNYFDLMPGDEKMLVFEKSISAQNTGATNLNDLIIEIREKRA